MKGAKSYKITAIAWSNFKWGYWANSCLLRNIFHKRAHPHSLLLAIDSNTTCPEMPRSALQGQMAISEQPEPMLNSHYAMQSTLFPSSDVFQPAPGRNLTLTCVQLGNLLMAQREAQNSAGCNPCSMNPALSPSLPCCIPACLHPCWFSTQTAI